jgi:hypothetical protein
MTWQSTIPQHRSVVRNSTLLLIGFATVFFPRLLTYFGAPSLLNFVHFIVVSATSYIVVTTTRIKNNRQIEIVWQLIFAGGVLLFGTVASGIINNAGIINIVLQFMFNAEPFMFLIAMISIPLLGENLVRFRQWIERFCLFNLILAIAQSILLPIGLYPATGQLITDNTAGVFAAAGGSAGNYVSATVSIYFAIYYYNNCKHVPHWWRISVLIGAVYQTYISDSKQIFVAMFLGWLLVVLTKVENPFKILLYLIPILSIAALFFGALMYTDWEFLDAYRNFTTARTGLYGAEGEATVLKTAAFRIVPSYYTTPLNYIFGLGPGHSASRLAGWFLRDPNLTKMILPLGATIHPVTEVFWQLISSPSGWLARDSTMWFPMFTWVGIWGDLGLFGLGAYLYLSAVVWFKTFVDDFGKFLLMSTAVLGFILTQMEEPGQMLTVTCFLGLRWHEERQRQLEKYLDLADDRVPL